jgi:hypothetical protein
MNNDSTRKAIAANLEALGQSLDDIQRAVSQANHAMRDRKQNQAIGSIIDLDHKLYDAQALYRAALALHRKGGAR